MARIHQRRDTGPGLRDCLINLLGMAVAPPALHFTPEKMVGYRVEHRPRRLRARGVIKKNEVFLKRREGSAYLLDGELGHAPDDIRRRLSEQGQLAGQPW